MANYPIRRGMLLRHENHIYEITEFHERHAGKQRPTIHVALRDVRDGHPVDRTLDDLLPVDEVQHAYRRMQYLYLSGWNCVFMDYETFEEYELTELHLCARTDFLTDGAEYRVMFIDDLPASVEVPNIVPLKVQLTAPPQQAVGTASSITREAVLENGLEVRVPLFIKSGDVIKIDTRSRTYAGKDHA